MVLCFPNQDRLKRIYIIYITIKQLMFIIIITQTKIQLKKRIKKIIVNLNIDGKISLKNIYLS